jgi:hypothetical protein
MESVQSSATIDSSSLPIRLVFFHLVMLRHVLGPCNAHFEHAWGIEGYVTYYLACYVRLGVQNVSWCHLRK